MIITTSPLIHSDDVMLKQTLVLIIPSLAVAFLFVSCRFSDFTFFFFLMLVFGFNVHFGNAQRETANMCIIH